MKNVLIQGGKITQDNKIAYINSVWLYLNNIVAKNRYKKLRNLLVLIQQLEVYEYS